MYHSLELYLPSVTEKTNSRSCLHDAKSFRNPLLNTEGIHCHNIVCMEIVSVDCIPTRQTQICRKIPSALIYFSCIRQDKHFYCAKE